MALELPRRLGQQCSNQAALRTTEVHIDHYETSAHYWIVKTNKTAWKTLAYKIKLFQATSFEREHQGQRIAYCLNRPLTGLFHNWSRQYICEHTETEPPTLPLSHKALLSLPKSKDNRFMGCQHHTFSAPQTILSISWTHEVHTYGTFSLQSHLVFVHLHHPRPTASTTDYAGRHFHVRWLLEAKGWLALYLLDESRQKGRKGGTGLALPLHRECLSIIHFIITIICQEQGQIS